MILDSELERRKPVKRSHREVVGAAIMDGKLFFEVLQGVEGMAGIETPLILVVAAFDLAIVLRGVRTNQFMVDFQFFGSLLKKCRKVSLAVEEAVDKLKAIVSWTYSTLIPVRLYHLVSCLKACSH